MMMKAKSPASMMAKCCGLLHGGVLMAALLLASCTVEVQNRQAVQELTRRSAPSGSAYTGWRVFQDRCVACHGADATGTAVGPDLLPRVREMGARRFVSLVLKRYDSNFPEVQASSQSVPPDALIDDILLRREGALTMPAWQGEPRVTAHIMDLYAYLSARAEGTQGPGRPAK